MTELSGGNYAEVLAPPVLAPDTGEGGELHQLYCAIESATDGIAILDNRESYVYVNTAHAKVYGYDTPAELLGRNWRMLYDQVELRRFEQELMPLFRKTGLLRVEAVGKKRDGTYFPQEVSLTGLDDGGLICVVRDISERKVAAQQLEQLALFPTLNPGPVMSFDTEGFVQRVNPAAKRILNVPDDDTPVHLSRLIPEVTDLDLRECIHSAGFLSCCSWIGVRYFQFVFVGIPTLRVGHLYGSDITDLKRLQDGLVQSQKMEAIGQLAGGVAHDFNNLLTAIMGCSELLLTSSTSNAEEQRTARMIHNAAVQASQLTQKLLGFARKGKHQNIPVDMHAVISETTELLKRTLESHLTIKLDLHAATPCVMGDPIQLQQIILNLALNARDALIQNKSGGRPANLCFTTKSSTLEESMLEIEVRDTGCGIPPELADRIFEPFFTTKESGRGTGLGLSMVYGIVQNHGGEIRFESRVGEGSIFRVFLPCTSFERTAATPQNFAAPSTNRAPPATPARSAMVRKGTILVADDHCAVREVTEHLLTSLGYEVITAGDGVAAVQLYGTRWREIDLVILDMVMPHLGGAECLEQLRLINPDVKVVLATGYVSNVALRSGIPREVCGFLQKPFELAQLAEVVAQALESKQLAI